MFESLSDKLKRTLKNLRGEGVLTKEHVEAALREIRLALLEADVNYKVAKDFIASVKEKAEGAQVWQDLKPSEQVVKIVYDELVDLLGGQSSRLVFTRQIPNVVMIVGLQGSGKTTSTGKIARWLAQNQDRKPLLVSVDVYRPAAREQLRVIAKATGQQIFEQPETNDPLTLVREAYKHAQLTGFDTLLIDTAGRLHIDDDLMVELERIKQETHPVEVLFVADAMTGQDAVRSAEEFHKRVGYNGRGANQDGRRCPWWCSPFHQTGYRSARKVRRRRREIRRTRSFLSGPDRPTHPRDGRRPLVDRRGSVEG